MNHMSDEHLTTFFYPFLTKLVSKDWFTARASAATLAHLGFARLGNKAQEEVLAMFIRLCKDETPLVRRLAAQNIEQWTRLLSDSPHRQKEIVNTFKSFLNDDQVCARHSRALEE